MIVAGTSPPPPGARKYAMVLITYVACASFHASREAYVAVKGDFQRHLHFPTQLLGLLDTTFLVCYGIGLLFSGSIGARFGNKAVASVGLAATAAVLAAHGCLSKGWLGAPPTSADEAWAQGLSLYVPLVAVNGFVQSLGFPNLVAVTSGWVAPTQRGLVLGLWSTTGAVGDIVGLNVATAVLEGGVEWQTVFFAVSGYLGAMTVVLWTCVEDRGRPKATRKTFEATDDDATSISETATTPGETTKLLASARAGSPTTETGFGTALSGLAEAWAVPGVLDWSMSYFFIKTVTYTILFWMPYYLTLTLSSQAAADNLTVLFDVAMIVGCTLLGYITDKFGGTRSPGFFVSYIFGALPLLFLPALQRSIPHYAVAFGIIGVFTGGPAHMYGTAVSVDLGVAAAELGKPGLVSSLSGLIDGIGTLGAAVGQTLVGMVASAGETKTAVMIKKALDDAVNGEFLFISVWTIRLTPCFVYRQRDHGGGFGRGALAAAAHGEHHRGHGERRDGLCAAGLERRAGWERGTRGEHGGDGGRTEEGAGARREGFDSRSRRARRKIKCRRPGPGATDQRHGVRDDAVVGPRGAGARAVRQRGDVRAVDVPVRRRRRGRRAKEGARGAGQRDSDGGVVVHGGRRLPRALVEGVPDAVLLQRARGGVSAPRRSQGTHPRGCVWRHSEMIFFNVIQSTRPFVHSSRVHEHRHGVIEPARHRLRLAH